MAAFRIQQTTVKGEKLNYTLHIFTTRLCWSVCRVCKHCQFVFTSSVLSVMSVSGFPLIIMSAHAQCSMCTCSVEGIPSLVCPHMLSVGASLISMQCKHWRRRRIFGEDEEKVKNPSSLPEIRRLHQKKGRLRHKICHLD